MFWIVLSRARVTRQVLLYGSFAVSAAMATPVPNIKPPAKPAAATMRMQFIGSFLPWLWRQCSTGGEAGPRLAKGAPARLVSDPRPLVGGLGIEARLRHQKRINRSVRQRHIVRRPETAVFHLR